MILVIEFDFIYGVEKRGTLFPQAAAQHQQAQHNIFLIVCGERFFGCGTIPSTPATGDIIVVYGFCGED